MFYNSWKQGAGQSGKPVLKIEAVGAGLPKLQTHQHASSQSRFLTDSLLTNPEKTRWSFSWSPNVTNSLSKPSVNLLLRDGWVWMCPTRGALSKRRSLSSRVFQTAIFPQRVVLAIPPRRPENNHPRRVCQIFEKLTMISNCAYYSHILRLQQLHYQSQPWLLFWLCQYERVVAPGARVKFPSQKATVATALTLCFLFPSVHGSISLLPRRRLLPNPDKCIQLMDNDKHAI